jgi:small-conductance mechanosensitive channel
MPSPFPPLFLQELPLPPRQQEPAPQQREQPKDGDRNKTFELRPLDPPTVLYGYEVRDYAPVVVIPIFLGALALLSFLAERIAAFLIRRVATKTETRVDDVFVESLPRLVRAQLTFVALHVVADALVRGDANDKVAQVLTALNYVVVGVVVTRLGLRMTDAWVEGKPHLKPVGPGIKFAIKVLVIPILLVLVLQAFGQKVEAFLTVLGVGSLAVALALQDVLKNIFAGLQIVLDQPIRAGDFITLDDGKVRGTVLEIGLRSTKLRTLENNVVIIPNANLATAVVTNTELVDRAYTQTLTLGVDYGADTRHVQRVLEEETGRAIAESASFVAEPPKVLFREFGESALLFSVAVKVRQYSDRLEALGELNHRLHARLREEGIEIPFPQRTVHLRGPWPLPSGAAPAAAPGPGAAADQRGLP